MRIEERAALLKKVEKITDEMEEVRNCLLYTSCGNDLIGNILCESIYTSRLFCLCIYKINCFL